MPLRAGIAARASAPLSGRSTPILITGAGPPNRQELHTAKAKAATAAAWGRSTCRLSRFRLAALWQYLYSSFPLTPAVSWPRVRGVSPLLRGARVKTESTEHLKPRSQYAEEAVQLAIAGNWDDAVKLNKFIIDNLGLDEESQNRLGKALSELGKLKDAKLARRITKFLRGGNRYQAGVTSCEGSIVKLIVRETHQDPKFAGKPSFPMRRKREVEFRPYTKESLLAREVEAFAEDDEEASSVEGTPATDEVEEGMHEVEDDAETVDFSEDADGDKDDDEDEDE